MPAVAAGAATAQTLSNAAAPTPSAARSSPDGVKY